MLSVGNPVSYNHGSSTGNPPYPTDDPALGTTIMAVVYDGGVVMGADSRTSAGSYIANRAADKITLVHDSIFVCRSGSAADTQALTDYLKLYLGMHSLDLEEAPSVQTAAHLINQLLYSNKNHLMAGMIVAGWDKRNGPSVFNIPLGGGVIPELYSIGGSGSSYIYGYVDANFKKNMTKEEAQTFVKNAVSLAIARDGSSGGLIRTVTISADGVERELVLGDKLPKIGFGQ
eukprot:JP446875.1.p1 GENE.JP446875.1~~JP446875.1.p1  ORF type:complete len:231 (+),score=43.56 JP446875.1:31-723(+)